MRQLLIFASALALATPGYAKTVTVKMLNAGSNGLMAFEPSLIKIAPGDTVQFVPTNPAHNAESISTIMPRGATPFKGQINQPLTVKFTKQGVYGVKCLPHFGLGMVALIQVGTKPPNLPAAKVEAARLPALAKKKMTELLNFAR